MIAVVVKRYNNKDAVKIEQTFTDVVSLYEFLVSNGISIDYKDAIDDLNMEKVVYTTGLLNSTGVSTGVQ